jgi:hypothetical protein
LSFQLLESKVSFSNFPSKKKISEPFSQKISEPFSPGKVAFFESTHRSEDAMDVEERKEIFDILDTRSINFVPHTFQVGEPILEWASSFEKIDAEELKSEATPELMSEENEEDKERMKELLEEEKVKKKESDYTIEEQKARQEEVTFLYKPLLASGSEPEGGLNFDAMMEPGEVHAEAGGAFNLGLGVDLGGDPFKTMAGGGDDDPFKTMQFDPSATLDPSATMKPELLTAATIEIGEEGEGTVSDQAMAAATASIAPGGATAAITEAAPAAAEEATQEGAKKTLSREDKAKEQLRMEMENREKEAAVRKSGSNPSSPSGDAGGNGGFGELLIKEGTHEAEMAEILGEIESSAVDSSAVSSAVSSAAASVLGDNESPRAFENNNTGGDKTGKVGIDGDEKKELQEVGLDGMPKKRPSGRDSEKDADPESKAGSKESGKANSKEANSKESSKKGSKGKPGENKEGKDEENKDDDGASVNTPFEVEEGPVMVGLPMFADSMLPTPCVSAGDPDPDCMFLPALDEVFMFLHR